VRHQRFSSTKNRVPKVLWGGRGGAANLRKNEKTTVSDTGELTRTGIVEGVIGVSNQGKSHVRGTRRAF